MGEERTEHSYEETTTTVTNDPEDDNTEEVTIERDEESDSD